ncbi:IspD/TarI family cytidylyltransferase [Dermatobacter hominis]|uniref:IspD/TarI family cytidylyltransferase n=1 Tax=Dermatobacter hominis TaxID=2884263 RepID=UPI001D10FA24|nr:IspD/TarI family cytidylyltransferase [Dermatobacter hominis]UDY34467.1 2-C-methyl-D-erythritol 4-phosphate cytidylyltransferase [Dermatobacter hominis]
MAGDGTGEVWCVVVAAGSGSRFGGPKHLAELRGRTVLQRSIDVARRCADGVVVVVAPGSDVGVDGADVVVAGGDSRSTSVSNGLAAVPAGAEVVLVHDAARPLASGSLFARVVEAVRDGADAAVPVVTVVDTIRDLDGGTVDRDRLRAVQTPQGFRAAALRAVHARGAEATDDAALVEADGGTVALVEGERANLKITEPADLDVAAALLDRAAASGGDSAS